MKKNQNLKHKNLISGDWSLKLWSEDICGSPLQWLWSGQHRLFVTVSLTFA